MRRVKKEHPTRPEGGEASYQDSKEGSWKPVEPGDKAMSNAEQGWLSQINRKALGKAWGMNMLRINHNHKEG